MSDKAPLESLTGEYYSNILLLHPDGSPLTTVSLKRANWYLKRDLAESLGEGEGYANRVRLKFEPKDRTSNKFLQAILPTQCVVCGSKEKLTVHHVVPLAIKRFFPSEMKDHTRQWCVLVCEEHHLAAEKLCRPLYEQGLQNAVNTIQKEQVTKGKLYHKIIHQIEISNHLINTTLEALHTDEASLLGPCLRNMRVVPAELENFKELIKIGRELCRGKVKVAKKEWARQFIENHGGIENIKTIFRDNFMQLEPRFLAEGFLKDTELS